MIGPALAFGAVRIVDVHAAPLAAISGDDLICAIAVQIRGENGVALIERLVDDLSLPDALLLVYIHPNLIAVPRFDGREEASLRRLGSKPSGGHIARACLGPRQRTAPGKLRPR